MAARVAAIVLPREHMHAEKIGMPLHAPHAVEIPKSLVHGHG
jgi:hypothetical protein